MCGPIVASYALTEHPAPLHPLYRKLLPHLLYNAGRITTYSLVGLIMGVTGSFVNVAGKLAGIQNVIAILSGLLMIFMGLSIAGIHGTTRWIEQRNSPVLRAAQRVRSAASPFRFLALGLVLGLLPCGLSYTIFIAAAGTGNSVSGMTTALLFGLGTLPALLTFGTLVSAIGSKLRGRVYRAGGVFVIIMGIYFLARGIRIYAAL
jgi:sulfite exporter TauE/SafE